MELEEMVSEDTKQFIINLRKEELDLYNWSLNNENVYTKDSNIEKIKKESEEKKH